MGNEWEMGKCYIYFFFIEVDFYFKGQNTGGMGVCFGIGD